ncbi:MAG: dihydropteroate synthase, partial [Sporichthyaceae bacterium]
LDMAERAIYTDVLTDVVAELTQQLDQAVAGGIDPDHVILDPGLGFAKNAQHNWALLAGLDRLITLGRPVLVAASRKAFLGRLLPDADGVARPVAEREAAGAAVAALAAANGAWCVRSHDARTTRDAVEVAAAWTAARPVASIPRGAHE